MVINLTDESDTNPKRTITQNRNLPDGIQRNDIPSGSWRSDVGI